MKDFSKYFEKLSDYELEKCVGGLDNYKKHTNKKVNNKEKSKNINNIH